MAKDSWYWSSSAASAGSGDQKNEYTQDDMASAHKVIAGAGASEGVIANAISGLSVQNQGNNTVRVQPGRAVVDGHPFELNSASDLNIETAVGGGNTRIDRVVVRVNWGNFDVSASVIPGEDAADPSAPALTTEAGSIYDLPLAQALIDTSASVTTTDERTWSTPPLDDATLEVRQVDGRLRVGTSGLSTINFGASQVTGAKIGTSQVDVDKLASNAVTNPKIANNAVDTAELADEAVTTAKINSSAVDNDALAADSVDDTKAGNRVPQLYRRAGGSNDDWNISGGEAKTPGAVRIQVGAASTAFLNESQKTVEVDFPVAFSNSPLCFATAGRLTGTKHFVASIDQQTAVEHDSVGVVVHVKDGTNVTDDAVFSWMAIGTE